MNSRSQLLTRGHVRVGLLAGVTALLGLIGVGQGFIAGTRPIGSEVALAEPAVPLEAGVATDAASAQPAPVQAAVRIKKKPQGLLAPAPGEMSPVDAPQVQAMPVERRALEPGLLRVDRDRTPDLGEAEPNDSPGTATSLLVSDVVARGNVYAAGGSDAADVDYWSFTGTAGDRILVAIEDSFGNFGSGDSEVTLLRADGGTPIELERDANELGDFASATLPASETYYVEVRHLTQSAAAGDVRPYSLHFRELESASGLAPVGPDPRARQWAPAVPNVDEAFDVVSSSSSSSNLLGGPGRVPTPGRPVAQVINAGTYAFTSASSVALEDMSSGATVMLAADLDDTATPVTPIGFDFWYDGVRQTLFSVNANGLMRLGVAPVGTTFSNVITSTTNIPQIAPYWDDMWIGNNGRVHFKVVGAAPNRKLVVEWQNLLPRATPFTGGFAGTMTFQAWLFESSGVIELVYGPIAANAANTGYTVGLSTAAASFAAVTTSSNTVSYAVANDAQTNAIPGGQAYLFTPNAPAPPGPLSFTGVGLNTMTLNWADTNANEVGYAIYRSVDGITYDFIRQTAANVTSSVETGLASNTVWVWRVVAVTEGGVSAPSAGSFPTFNGAVSGTRTIGPTGFYTSIGAAVTDINTNGLAGSVILELQSTYTSGVETFPLVINALGFLSSSITLRPEAGAVGLSITSAAAQTIQLAGATGVIIDGRAGGVGPSQLTIANTSLTGAAVQFINGAIGNTLRSVSITGVNNTATGAVVLFSGSTGQTGNNRNTIENSDIRDGATTPVTSILSIGTANTNLLNTANTITNNNISNFFSGAATTLATNGIFLNTATNITNTGWTITNNRFFQTAPRVYLTGATHRAIQILQGNNYDVSGNIIGFANSAGTGTFAVSGGNATAFLAISLTVGDGVSGVQGNNITNVAFGSTTGAFTGIALLSGSANIGNTVGNTIGSGTGNGAITSTHVASSGGTIFGINVTGSGVGQVRINNNTIGSLTSTASTTFNSNITGLQMLGGYPPIVSNNLIGSATTANSIQVTTTGASATAQQILGMNFGVTMPTTITGNTIANLTNAGTGTAHLTGGLVYRSNVLQTGNGAGFGTITLNNIHDIAGASANTTVAGGQTAVQGLLHTGTSVYGSSIDQNTVSAIIATNTGAVSNVASGIGFSNPNLGTVTRNKICDIRNASTGTSATAPPMAIGLLIRATGTTGATFANNMIDLGASQTTNTQFVGIMNSFFTTSANIFYNSVRITGTAASGALPSYGFLRGDNTAASAVATPLSILNDIFHNERTGGTGKHYAIGNVNTVPATGWGPGASDRNVLNSPVATTVGIWGLAADQTFAGWQAISSCDTNSLSATPVPFVGPCDLHLSFGLTPTPIESHGIAIPGVTNDFDNQTRPNGTAPDIGADEFVGVPGCTADPQCADGNACTTDTCSVATFTCVFTPNTAACSDGNACTTGDTCAGGLCVPGTTPTVCNDNNGCTDDTCVPATGCVFTADPTNACDDGNPCTVGDTCGLTGASLVENFDGVVAPALPPGWTETLVTGVAGTDNWRNQSTTRDTVPNAPFCNDPGAPSEKILTSPAFPVGSAPAQVVFRQNFAFESGFDGGVLEIMIGASAFQDILTAGGTLAPGYTGTISNAYGSPLGNRQAWTGSSAGFITTTVTLPAAAANNSVRLRWRAASDTVVSSTGWFIDTITSNAGAACVPGTGMLNCSDGNFCTDETCVPTAPGGCVTTPHVCDDSLSCTADTCVPPTVGCVFTPIPGSCEDNNPCTDNICLVTGGCSFPPHSCDDSNACTADTCDPTRLPPLDPCVHAPVTCADDGNPCTDTICNPMAGCQNVNDNTNTCTDGNACTVDVCNAGACGCPPSINCNPPAVAFGTMDVPKPISSVGTPVVTSNLVVAGAGTYLADVDVRTFITHTFSSDLQFTITSPAGTIVTLSTDNGGGNDNVFNGTTFDDDADPGNQVPYASPLAASNLVTDTAYVNNVVETTLVPEDALGAFIGENPNGTWVLTVADAADTDGGSLDNWSLLVKSLPSAPTATTVSYTSTAVPVAIPNSVAVSSTVAVSGAGTQVGRVRLTTSIQHTFPGDLDITLRSPAGTVVTLTTDNGGGSDNVYNGTLWDDDADPSGPVPYPLSATTLATSNLVTDTVYANNVLETTLVPEESLSAFVNEDPNGTWLLTISDDAAPDTGNLSAWSLEITTLTCTVPCAVNCDDNNPCTTDSCDSVLGCQHANNTLPCDDGNVCTDDACAGGACVGTNDNTNLCTDGLACTTDQCTGGACVSTAVSCDDGDPCTLDVCNEPAGNCTHPVNPACLGACCLPDGCQSLLQTQCDAQGGVFQGLLTACPSPFGIIIPVVPPLAIPDNAPAGVSTTFTIPAASGVTITDLDVDLDITHTWVGDLRVTITHGATTVTLIDQPGVPPLLFGCSSDNYTNLLLDDEGTSGTIESTCLTGPPAAGPAPAFAYTPNSPLSAFDGQSSAGVWTLTVSDVAAAFTGTLNSWSLHVSPNPAATVVCPGFGACCYGNELCVVTTEARCTDPLGAFQGTYGGDGTRCFVPHEGPSGSSTNFVNATPVPIPDNPGPVATSTIVVPPGLVISDLNVDLSVTHTFMSDLDFTLEHVGFGGPVAFLHDRCGGFDNWDIVLDDEGAAFPGTCVNNQTGTFQPDSPLSVFDGQDAGGTWILTVDDDAAPDAGTLNRWSLHITESVPFCNEEAICDAGGPFSGDCRTATVSGASVSDAEGDAISYHWESSDPNVTVNPPNAGIIPAGAGSRPIPPTTASLSPFANPAPPAGYSATLTLVVEDVRGTSRCTTTVTFLDDDGPTISCPADATRECTEPTDVGSTGSATATDNCQAATTTFSAVQVNMLGAFDTDVIVNNGVGLDTTQGPIDDGAAANNWAFETQSTAVALGCPTPAGIPDDGFFAADAFHPDVQLFYNNFNNGNNARQLLALNSTFTVGVPSDNYAEVHVFATSGQGDINMAVTLTYSDATTTTFPVVLVPDWFNEVVPTPAAYYLVDGRDRAKVDASSCQDSNDAAIFGFRFTPDVTKTLTNVTVTRGSGGNAGSKLSVFGITGLTQQLLPAQPVLVSSSDSSTQTSNGTCSDQSYTITRTWTATDNFGNTSTCAQTITVRDTVAPTITSCPGDVTVECPGSTAPSATGSPTATDNCDATVAVTHSDARIDGSCSDNYRIVRTWIATDNCGNSTTCTQTITHQDTTAPVISCPPNVTVECGSSTEAPPEGVATATDGCDGTPTLAYTDAVVNGGGCPVIRVITRTWTATDNCGNSASCVQTLTVVDTRAPVITTQPRIDGSDCNFIWPPEHGYATYDVANMGLVATDICSPGGSLTVSVASCTSSQPEDGQGDDDVTGDGSTDRDCVISPDGQHVSMRAERSGSCHIDRNYRIVLSVSDACGNSVLSAPREVCVYHDRGHEPPGAYRSSDEGTNSNTVLPGTNGTYGTSCGSGCACDP